MQRDCALRIAGRGRLTSFYVEYKTGNHTHKACLSVLNRLQRKSGGRHTITPFSKAIWVLEPVDPRDVIYTKTRLTTP
ncbi:hypothetical protein TNCV_4397101 [Trichonephila clavipes]|nr:hypothetical protein TNCV_4397101 [Trichonephila clavipes]